MIRHIDLTPEETRKQIKNKLICFAGNSRLRIYGKLHCASGKRLKKENRVFFVSQAEASAAGYRPCAHCMSESYKNWKHAVI
jgi:methylphosphotriester-DNA--protein-cysteine methyltransferase